MKLAGIAMALALSVLVAGAPSPPKEAGRRYALLIEHGRGFRDLLVDKYKLVPEDVVSLGPETEPILKRLDEWAGQLKEGDLLFIASCGHTIRGSLIFQCSLEEVEKRLAKIKAFKVVVQATCHSGEALTRLPSADVVYVSCAADAKCGGVFQRLFHQALSDPKLADTNSDGHITFGEAFDYANQRDLVQAEYVKLSQKSPEFWPFPSGPMPLRRATPRQYQACIVGPMTGCTSSTPPRTSAWTSWSCQWATTYRSHRH